MAKKSLKSNQNGAKARKRGQPTKATPERLQAILDDIARGLTIEQACACNGCSHDSFQNWLKKPENLVLRAQSEAARIKDMMQRIEQCGYGNGDWKRFQWFLQCKFPAQFGDQSHLQIFAQQNNYQITDDKAREIDVRIVESTKRLTNGD